MKYIVPQRFFVEKRRIFDTMEKPISPKLQKEIDKTIEAIEALFLEIIKTTKGSNKKSDWHFKAAKLLELHTEFLKLFND